MRLNEYGKIFKNSLSGWGEDRVATLSAAIAYYTVFSIAPLLLIAIAVAGLFWGEEAVRGEIFGSVRGLVGDQGAVAIQSFVESASLSASTTLATIVGVVTLIVGATSLFAQLQESLNRVWKVKTKPHAGIWPLVRQRLLSLSLILVIAFVLLVSLILSAVISAASKYAQGFLPGGSVIWRVVDIAFSLGVTTVLFAAIYKILPDVRLRWRDVWAGGLTTAVLFTIGKSLIGLYLGKSTVSSSYGAAGSLVIILLWTYYSSMVLMLGAEFTRYHSMWGGRKLELKANATWIQTPQKIEGRARPKRVA